MKFGIIKENAKTKGVFTGVNTIGDPPTWYQVTVRTLWRINQIVKRYSFFQSTCVVVPRHLTEPFLIKQHFFCALLMNTLISFFLFFFLFFKTVTLLSNDSKHITAKSAFDINFLWLQKKFFFFFF